MNQRIQSPQPKNVERSARALFFAAHISPLDLAISLAVIAVSVACLCGIFDGPDVVKAAQSGITPEMLEGHFYAMRVVGVIGICVACTKLYGVARKVRAHPKF